LLPTFSQIYFSHIYRDKNMIADKLSKVGLELDQGIWMVTIQQEGNTMEYEHESWI
jgi:hypothetical protein